MSAKTIAKDARDAVVSVLRHTPLGRQLQEEAAEAAEREAQRRAARERLDEAEDLTASLPALQEAAAAAQATYESEMRRLGGELRAARGELRAAAQRASRLRSRADAVLRNTASPLVHERGPVVAAVRAALDHLRGHQLGREFRLVDGASRLNLPPDHRHAEVHAKAKREVADHQLATEAAEAFLAALDDLRDAQLAFEADEGEVRDLAATCPSTCPVCRDAFGLEAATEKALAPKENT